MNKDIVFKFLSNSKKSFSAYEILHHLRNSGFKAPMTIYRALDTLIDEGIVHKINNEKKYVVCSHNHRNKNFIFATCKNCKAVIEHHSRNLNKLIKLLCQNSKFKPKKSNLTIEGYCSECKE